MKNSRLLIIVLTFTVFFSCLSFAQNNREITGKIIDVSTQGVVPEAMILISQEGKIIDEAFTDDKGNFSFSLPDGSYDLIIEVFGYEKQTKPIQVSESSLVLEPVLLEEIIEEQALDGLVITARKTTIVNTIDRKIVTVGDDLAAASQDLSQVMNTIPGIQVDQNNQISLRGSSNVKVLVDGKPTTMTFEQIMKQYPPNMIDKVEVLTNPPAKYSPEGKSGIVNIILKKNAKRGTNLNLNTAYIHGAKSKYTNGIDFNQGFKKFNIFGNAGYNVWNFQNSGYIFQNSVNSFQTYKIEGQNINRYGKVGIDYFLNDQNTISFYTYHSGDNTDMLNNSYKTDDSGTDHIKQEQDDGSKYQEYDLFYKSEFAKSGHKLEFQANYNKYDEDRERYSSLKRQESGDLQEKNYRGNIDYTNPLSDNSELTAGAEIRINRYRDNYGNVQVNFYEFDRDIYSLYAEYKKQWERFGFKAGVRGEYSDTRTESDFPDTQGFKNYKYQVYPTLHTSYKLGKEKKTEVSLNYSRRVSRPWAGLFSPVSQFSLGTIVFSGNDNLKPEYTNSYEIGISTSLSKLYIGANLFYRDIKDEINQKFVERTGYIEIINENIRGNDQYGGELDLNYSPFKWWSINSGFEYYWGKVSGDVQNQWYERNMDRYVIKATNSFTLPKSFNVQLFGQFRSKEKDLQNNYKERWKVDVSVKKAVMEDRLSFTLSVSDVFNTQHSEYEMLYPSYIKGRSDWESRRINLSVKYNFASGKIKKTERKNIENNTKKGGGIL